MHTTQVKICQHITALHGINGTIVQIDKHHTKITVKSRYALTPDFHLIWNEVNQCFYVYIYIGDTQNPKSPTGYAIMTIKTLNHAADFITMHGAIRRTRSNKKP